MAKVKRRRKDKTESGGRRRARGRRRGGGILRLVVIGLLGAGVLLLLDQIPLSRSSLPPRNGPALTDVSSWGYQLQKVRTARMPKKMDVLVVDYSRDGTDRRAFKAKDLARLRKRGPKRPPRIILAYLSVGEAERYRYYWWPHWGFFKPAWLGDENENWEGNYLVRFWKSGWQSIIYRPKHSVLDWIIERAFYWRKPYLDRILDVGFDGVYLDRVDVYDEWSDDNGKFDRAMVDFVNKLSGYARTRKKDFLIVPQNGEELLRFAAYRRAIDGIAKEDLLYGIDGDGKKNPKSEILKTMRFLKTARQDDLPVFVVEYLQNKKKRLGTHRFTDKHGFILHFAKRELDKTPRVMKRLPPLKMPRVAKPQSKDSGQPADSRATVKPAGKTAPEPPRKNEAGVPDEIAPPANN